MKLTSWSGIFLQLFAGEFQSFVKHKLVEHALGEVKPRGWTLSKLTDVAVCSPTRSNWTLTGRA